MSGLPEAREPRHPLLDEIVRQKLLIDVMFGASGTKEYEQASGEKIGDFSLCLLNSLGDGERPVSAADILSVLKGITICHGACAFAVAPGRVAVFAERSWQIGSQPGCEAIRSALAEVLGGAIDSEAAEGFGAEELCACYQRCAGVLVERQRRVMAPREGMARPASAGRNVKPVLSKAIDYIEKHFTEQITLQDVAEHAFASSFYISRLFNKELGVGFVDYLGALRVENARRLLCETQLRIFEVSERVGIQDAHYFAKLFKKHTGVSPSQYRTGNRL